MIVSKAWCLENTCATPLPPILFSCPPPSLCFFWHFIVIWSGLIQVYYFFSCVFSVLHILLCLFLFLFSLLSFYCFLFLLTEWLALRRRVWLLTFPPPVYHFFLLPAFSVFLSDWFTCSATLTTATTTTITTLSSRLLYTIANTIIPVHNDHIFCLTSYLVDAIIYTTTWVSRLLPHSHDLYTVFRFSYIHILFFCTILFRSMFS